MSLMHDASQFLCHKVGLVRGRGRVEHFYDLVVNTVSNKIALVTDISDISQTLYRTCPTDTT